MGVLGILNLVQYILSALFPVAQKAITDVEAAGGDASAHKQALAHLSDAQSSVAKAVQLHTPTS
jgi:hypothetical protein